MLGLSTESPFGLSRRRSFHLSGALGDISNLAGLHLSPDMVRCSGLIALTKGLRIGRTFEEGAVVVTYVCEHKNEQPL